MFFNEDGDDGDSDEDDEEDEEYLEDGEYDPRTVAFLEGVDYCGKTAIHADYE